jgi:hypothetical protein
MPSEKQEIQGLWAAVGGIWMNTSRFTVRNCLFARVRACIELISALFLKWLSVANIIWPDTSLCWVHPLPDERV